VEGVVMTTSGGRPPELSAWRFIVAAVVCVAEYAVWAWIAGLIGWPDIPYLTELLEFLLLLFVWGVTWTVITGEKPSESLVLGPYRKLWRGSRYGEGFAAGRDDRRWDELDAQAREDAKFFRGWQDGMVYRDLRRSGSAGPSDESD